MQFRTGFEKGFSNYLKDLGVEYTYEGKSIEYVSKPKKYNFLFADKFLPDEWLKEKRK